MEQIENALYIVATPIGNVSEASERSKFVLANVDVIACEDTRELKKLLGVYGIDLKSREIVSIHEHNEFANSSQIIGLIEEGKSVAYTSDAGTPAVSDPGALLVDNAHKRGVRVIPVSGPSAVIDAFCVSGFSNKGFSFLGFFPRSKSEKDRLIDHLNRSELCNILYESPKRLPDTLKTLSEHLGESRRGLVAREMTKKFEQIKRGTFPELAKEFSSTVKGECVIVIEGLDSKPDQRADEQDLKEAISVLKKAGVSSRDVIHAISKLSDVSKNELKEIYLKEK